jgi:hypothetical protein
MRAAQRHRPHGRAAGLQIGPGLIAKSVVAAIIAALAIWLTLAVSIASILGDSLPRVALRWAPFDARTMAGIAEDTVMTSADPQKADRAAALAKRALQRDPTVIPAWRTIGLALAARGREEDAGRLMAFTHRLSRRDLPTELWLIEDSVRRNDVDGALRHYDTALRTSSEAGEILLPIMVAALDKQELVKPIAALVADDPPWAPGFFDYLTRQPPRGDNAAALLDLVRKDGYSAPMPNASQLPQLLVQRGEFAAAYKAYRVLQQGDRTITDANDQFAKSPKVIPFDWNLAATSDVRAEPQLRNESDRFAALHVLAGNGAIDTAARKLAMLHPGQYVLAAAIDSEGAAPESLRWSVRCASTDTTLLVADVTPKSPGRKTWALRFEVPAQCPAQWLELSVRAPEGFDPAELWVENFSLRPAAPTPSTPTPIGR